MAEATASSGRAPAAGSVATASQDRFPDWARVLIAIVLAVASYLATSQTALDEQTRAAIGTAIALVSATGVIPPLPQTLRMSRAVSIVLTIVVGVVTYVLNVSVDMNPDVRGVIMAVLSVLASVGIRPPQVAK